MYKLFQYFIGYRKMTFRVEDTEKIYNFLFKYKIANWGYFSAEEVSCLYISNIDYKYLSSVKDALDIEIEVSESLGLPKILNKYKKRKGLLLGMFLFSLVLILSSLFVWDVRVIGAYTQNENEIIENLKNEGLHIGTFIPKIKSTEICNSYIMKYDNIAWMSINTRGNVVNVEIIESENSQKGDGNAIGKKYANLVACEDAVIEEINPSRGQVVTLVGKTVKKGDLLISGVYESPRKYSFVYASGNVYGRVNRSITVNIPYKQTIKEYKKSKLLNFSIKFFNFQINIYRYSGKMPTKYDTIYKREEIILFDKVKLPVYIVSDRCYEYVESEISLSSEDAVKLAFSRLKSELAAATIDCELVSKSITGEFTDSSYVLSCDAECIKNIAVPLEFEVN